MIITENVSESFFILLNKWNDSTTEYQGDLGPDKHDINLLVHYLSLSNNYYSEETFNNLIRLKGISSRPHWKHWFK